MYGGYQGGYPGYGNQYPAASTNAANAYHQQHAQYHQQHQQHQQYYYSGVNPYANYGYGNVALQPPPPPPPPPPQNQVPNVEDSVAAQFRTFPAGPTKLNVKPGKFNQKPYQGGYNGGGNAYEAAVYNYANQQNQKPWQRKYGNGQSADNKQFYCEVCKISCAGTVTYKEHLDGQKHKKKELAAKQGLPAANLAKNRLSYRCDLCDVTTSGQDTYQAHIKGSKHMKTVALHRKLGKPVPEDVPTIIAPGEDGPIETKAKPKWHQQQLPGGKRIIGINTVNFVGGTKLSSTGQLEEKQKMVAEAVGGVGRSTTMIEVEDERLQAMMEAEVREPVGEEHVSEERDATGKLISFHCKLCDCSFSDPMAKDVHTRGRRHRLSYKSKVDPTFVVDTKPSKQRRERNPKAKENNGGSNNNNDDNGSFNGNISATPTVSTTINRGPWFAQPTSEGRELNISDERYIEEKYRTLNPGSEFMTNIDKMVGEINDCLKVVSEKVERFVRGIPDTVALPEDKEKPRAILGLARIGNIATNTFIKGEPIAEIAVSCSSPPTVALMQMVKEHFTAIPSELTIADDSLSPVCLLVTASYFSELPCRLYFTSTAVRNVEGSSECPDSEMCIRALALIRHVKWYDSHCQFLNSCQPVIRLFRDMRSRHPIFEALGDYPLELLVANVIDSSSCSLNPAEAFKRVLEAISSGYLYSAILADPCETTKPNVLDAISEEHKYTMTDTAQNMLRLIAFNQIYEVLGIERICAVAADKLPLKRSLETDTVEEEVPEVKKERVEENEENGNGTVTEQLAEP